MATAGPYLPTITSAGVLRSIRVHGQGIHKYDNVRIGLNGRLNLPRPPSSWPSWKFLARRSKPARKWPGAIARPCRQWW